MDPTGHWYYDPGCDCIVDTGIPGNEHPDYLNHKPIETPEDLLVENGNSTFPSSSGPWAMVPPSPAGICMGGNSGLFTSYWWVSNNEEVMGESASVPYIATVTVDYAATYDIGYYVEGTTIAVYESYNVVTSPTDTAYANSNLIVTTQSGGRTSYLLGELEGKSARTTTLFVNTGEDRPLNLAIQLFTMIEDAWPPVLGRPTNFLLPLPNVVIPW